MGDGAGAAERVEQRRGLVPAGGQQQGGRQGLAQRRFGDCQAVAAFVQECPGGVRADGALVSHQPHDDQLRRMTVGFFICFDERRGLSEPFIYPRQDSARHRIRMI